MRRFVTLVLFFVFVFAASAQEVLRQCSVQVPEMQRPKLVVGIVVDQMRWDYLTRFYDRYGDGGFKRLMADGYNCNRLMINYIPAVTAVGHASIYTGSIPAITGIVGNYFFINGKLCTSVQDANVKTVGTDSKAGMASPHNLLVTTITDELRLATNFRAKAIGIALKDRAAILPTGHTANGVYWFDTKNLSFVTSSYYMEELPQWVKDFNNSGKVQSYVKLIDKRKNKDDYWDLLYPEETYVQSGSGKHEIYYGNMGKNITYTPWGNTITADMAIAAIDAENLGHNPDNVPDFLAVSFSCTDLISHQVGPNSIWQEDVFLRLDKDIARLLTHLDEQVGKDNYVVFLSADHAGAHNTVFLKNHKIPAGSLADFPVIDEVNDSLKSHFGIDGKIVKTMENLTFFLDNDYIAEVAKQKNVDVEEFTTKVMSCITKVAENKKEINYCFPFRNIPSYIPEPIRTMAQNGYYAGRTGEMQIIPASQYIEDTYLGRKKGYDGIQRGMNHIVWNPYDTHIPFIVMGKNIRHAWDNSTHHITDISATLASILNIQQPSGCVGDAIDVIDRK